MQKIFLNVFWLVLDKAIPLGLMFLVNVFVARHLGAVQFGRLSFLIAIASLFIPVASLGLNNIITREIINRSQFENIILGTAAAFRFSAALIVSTISFGSVLLLTSLNDQDSWILFLMTLSLCFHALFVVEFWIHSKENNHRLVIFRTPALMIGALLKIAAIYWNQDYMTFALLWGADIVLQGGAILLMYIQSSGARWKIDWGYGLRLLNGSWWLMLSGMASIVYLKMDQIMLGIMLDDRAVGIYAAASRFTEIWFFLPVAIVTATFPTLLRTRQTDVQWYRLRLKYLTTVLLYVAILIATGISLFAEQIVTFFYGIQFVDATGIVVIHIWSAIFVFIRAMVSKWLIAEDLLPFSLFSHGLGAVANVAFNIVLIPVFGVEGAAWATLVAFFTSTFLAFVMFSKTRYICWIILKSALPFLPEKN